MSRLYKYTFLLLTALLSSVAFMACTDDAIPEPQEAEESAVMTDPDGMVLKFKVQLYDTSGTRDEPSAVDDETIIDKYDYYVDTENMFKVLIFDQKGDFLFESKNRVVKKSADDNGQWEVTIPLDNEIRDGNNKSLLGSIRTIMENNPFKIAVLANWHTGANWEKNPNHDNNVNVDAEAQGRVTPYPFPWGWEQSALNQSAVTDKKVKNINDLHHLVKDNTYSSTSKSSTSNSNLDVFSYLMDSEYKMGLKTDWVTTAIQGMDESYADSYIRDNWNPNTNYSEDPFWWRYNKLWQVWNFGGAYPKNKLKYWKLARDKDDNSPILSEANEGDLSETWNLRNANSIRAWFDHAENGELGDFTLNGENSDYLSFIASNSPDVTQDQGEPSFVYNNDGYYGIALGRTNHIVTGSTSKKPELNLSSEYNGGYIRFLAPATGKLRIIWSSAEQGQKAKFTLQRGTTYEAQEKEYSEVVPKQYYKAISITQDPEYIYIYNQEPNPVVIYAIEYICDKYLSDTDRLGMEQPIPMYGVQNFPAISNWGSAPEIDLSRSGLNVNLVRSVAKVEVYIKDTRKVSYIGMRSMNRASRCEPMDVETPTNRTWARLRNTSYHDEAHCEWFDLLGYGPGYKSDVNDLSNYQNWYSWFYGAWNQKFVAGDNPSFTAKSGNDWMWNWNGKAITVPSSEYYPHVFNPVIQRSDFCEFIPKADYNGYQRFILYMPDKFIDDPNSVGNRSSTPKVAHIEYRFEKQRDEYLDDNNGHRIYFTDYSENKMSNIYSDEFDDLEKNHTEYFWPVMRNHIYRFYVGGDNETQEVHVKVMDFIPHDTPKKVEW